MNEIIPAGPYAGHFISAPCRSGGKSLLTMGLARLAKRRALSVQTFKKGPDYIDPLWLKSASGAPCYNLDPYVQSPEEWQRMYRRGVQDVVLVEGTMGLHDGLAIDGSDSNAAIAKRLGIPVLLIVDCRGMHRTLAALVNGLTQFDPQVSFSGIVLNRVRSERHVKKIEQAINGYCDIDILGVVPEQKALDIAERELGLVPAPDHKNAASHIDGVADVLETSCDIDALFSKKLTRPATQRSPSIVTKKHQPTYRIGIAQDEAFHFYYEDDLETLRKRGVELIPFSPIRDRLPAGLDGVIIGGGFPERHAEALSNNTVCREALALEVANGLPVRAECGGLMYLCRSIEYQQIVWPMVGVIDGAAIMQHKPQGRGYMKLKRIAENAAISSSFKPIPAHEFHHSSINFRSAPSCLYEVVRGHGIDGHVDGICVKNVFASYAHLRHTTATPWIDWFLKSVHDVNTNAQSTSSYV